MKSRYLGSAKLWNTVFVGNLFMTIDVLASDWNWQVVLH